MGCVLLGAEERRQKRNKYAREWHQKNKVRINAARRQRYTEDEEYRQKMLDNARTQFQNNRERCLETNRKWAKENPEKVRSYKRNYWLKNREKWRAYKRRWRALKQNSGGSHTDKDIELLFVSQEGLCAYCSVELGDSWHVDHMMPLSRGGTDDPVNLALACAPCNLSKGSKTVEEFLNETVFT